MYNEEWLQTRRVAFSNEMSFVFIRVHKSESECDMVTYGTTFVNLCVLGTSG